MSLSVVPLRAECPPTVRAQMDILNGLMARGELRELSWVADTGATVQTGFSSTEDQFARLGRVARLMHRLQKAIDEGA